MATNVNADEAAVMGLFIRFPGGYIALILIDVIGAAFYGAATKTSFRTKPMTVQDIGAWDINLTYGKEFTDKTIVTAVLAPKSKVGQRHYKKLAFPKRTVDFTISVAYKEPYL